MQNRSMKAITGSQYVSSLKNVCIVIVSANHPYLLPGSWIVSGPSSTKLAKCMWNALQWLLPDGYLWFGGIEPDLGRKTRDFSSQVEIDWNSTHILLQRWEVLMQNTMPTQLHQAYSIGTPEWLPILILTLPTGLNFGDQMTTSVSLWQPIQPLVFSQNERKEELLEKN